MSEQQIERNYKPPLAVFTIPPHYLVSGRPCDNVNTLYGVEAALGATVQCPLVYCHQNFVVVDMKKLRQPQKTKILVFKKIGNWREGNWREIEVDYSAEVENVSQPLLPE